MSKRFKEIVDKLYHPPRDGKRQVIAMSRGEAEKLPRLPTIAVVSITAPERPMAALDGFEHLLRMSFADVDFLNPDISPRAKSRASAAFTKEQAAQILQFVAALPDHVQTVVVHCEGGYSRSCAVALALHERYGYEVEMARLLEANKSILNLLESSTNPPSGDMEMR